VFLTWKDGFFMKTIECPFLVADREIKRLKQETPIVFVDFHAEATSENRR